MTDQLSGDSSCPIITRDLTKLVHTMQWGQHHCVIPTVQTVDQVPLKQNRGSPTISLVQYCMWPPAHVQLKCDGYICTRASLGIHITALRVQIPCSRLHRLCRIKMLKLLRRSMQHSNNHKATQLFLACANNGTPNRFTPTRSIPTKPTPMRSTPVRSTSISHQIN